MTWPDSVDDHLTLDGVNLKSTEDYIIETVDPTAEIFLKSEKVNIDGDLYVNGVQIVNDIIAGDDIHFFGGDITATGDATNLDTTETNIAGTLDVAGNTTIAGDTSITGDVTIANATTTITSDDITFNGNVLINGKEPVGLEDASTTNVQTLGIMGDGSECRDLIQAALDDAPYGSTLWFPKGDYLLKCGIQARSNVTMRGDAGARLVNTHPLGVGNNQTCTILFPGQYHPNWLHDSYNDVEGDMQYDTVSSPVWGDITVTLTSNTYTWSVGQLVMIHTDIRYPFLRRIKAISGNVITLHKGFDVDWTGHPCYITNGIGDGVTLNPIGDDPLLMPSGFIENFHFQGFTVHSAEGYWQAMSGCLDSTFRDIRVETSGALLYGNAYTDCRFENIRGNYRTRFIEIIDGARGNVVTDIAGTCHEVGQNVYEDSGTVLGTGDHLSNFSITEEVARSGAILRMTNERMTITDGKIHLVGPDNPFNIIEFGLNVDDTRLSNIDIHLKAPVEGTILRLKDVINANIENINVKAHGGYTATGSALTLNENVDQCVIDGFYAPDGNIEVVSNFEEETVDLTINNSRFNTIQGGQSQLIPGWVKGKNTSFTKRREAEKLAAHMQCANVTVTATTETPVCAYTLLTGQELNIADGFTVFCEVQKNGTLDGCYVKIKMFNAVILDFTILAAYTGPYVFQADIQKEVKVFSNHDMVGNARAFSTTGVAASSARYGGASLAAGAVCGVYAWKANAGDTLIVRRVKVVPNLSLF